MKFAIRRVTGQKSWLEKMRAWGVDYLFTAQDPISGAFPREDVWAQQAPPCFSLLYTRPRARIYRVMIP